MKALRKILREKKHLIIVCVLLVASVLAYGWLIHSPYFAPLVRWSHSNTLLFCALLFLTKTASILYPPIPGGIINLGAIPFIGWELAFVAYFLGSIAGSTIAFFLARAYGYRLLHKLFDEETIKKIRRVKIYPHREIEGIFVLKILLGATVIEAICYGAGLLDMRFRNFLIGSVLFHLVIGLPLYYLAANFMHAKNVPVSIAIVAAGAIVFWKLKRRYFYLEKEILD